MFSDSDRVGSPGPHIGGLQFKGFIHHTANRGGYKHIITANGDNFPASNRNCYTRSYGNGHCDSYAGTNPNTQPHPLPLTNRGCPRRGDGAGPGR